ncbi:MAG: GlsB/YeaQ/YmgE family stress response membrane protein [Spirochaetaceae bacterium]|nr:GlsB/YeaQ/YmgE family stress response membrane protein [Spirochaetaceae bacterium]MBR3814388.1 GlsB/YeaQ/YmgE family stress response membrane protein [Spirochaetaceae bacterium]MDD6487826.1 GlsB/YeaQ/YmgE family stress response membrane protein [Spirochaetales bacterium]
MILSIVLTILIGALVGWLAGMFMKSKHGFWMNCLLGIVGAALGGWCANLLHIGGGLIVQLIISVLGTCLLIFIVRLIMGKKF